MQDQQFISLAQNGNQEAVGALYEKYVDAIYRFFYWQTNQQQQLAEDLTHDTFVEMAKSIRNFRNEGNFRNWLYTIAKRQLAHWIKSKYDLPSEQLFDSIPQPADIIDPDTQNQTTKKVEQLLQTLEDTEKSVITLRYLRNFSVQETATELNLSVSNVKVIAHRAMNKLKKYNVT